MATTTADSKLNAVPGPTTGEKLNAVLGPIDVHLKHINDLLDRILVDTKVKVAMTSDEADQVEIIRHLDAINPDSEKLRAEINGLKPALGLFADELEEILIALDLVKDRVVESKSETDTNHPQLNDDRVDLDNLRKACRNALKQIRLLVTPFEFNEGRLTPLRIGLFVDFNKEYEQKLKTEIGGEDLRPVVLQKLFERGDVYGLVDREYGIVYKISETWGQYWARVGFVIALPLLGFVVVFAYCWLTQASRNPANIKLTLTDFWPLVWYSICFGGYVAHVVKKLLSAAGNKDPLVSDFVHWLEIKALPLASLGVSLWVVFGALLLWDVAGIRTVKVFSLQTTMIAFTAGYFVDSFAEPLLKQFDRRLSESRSSLNDLLKEFKPNSSR